MTEAEIELKQLELEELEAEEQVNFESGEGEADLDQSQDADIFASPETIPAALAEAVPGAKQIGSAVNATVDTVLGDEETGSWSEQYERNLGMINDSIDEASQRDPMTFNAIDFSTQMGLATVAGPTTLAQAGLSGINALSRSRNDGVALVKDTLAGTAVGGTLQFLAGSILPKVGGKIANRLKSFADDTTLSAVQPKESVKFLKKTKNLVAMRYKGDTGLAAQHADEIMNLKFAKTPAQLAQNASESKQQIGQQIGNLVDEIDDSAMTLIGNAKTKDGGMLKGELQYAVGGKSRFNQDHLPANVKVDYSQIDDYIKELTITTKNTSKNVKLKVEKMNPHTGAKEVSYVPHTEVSSEEVARQLSAKDIFQIKVKVANGIEEMFNKALNGNAATASQRASIKSQQARVVGKLTDVLDREVSYVASKINTPESAKLTSAFKNLNKKYAMANHLEEVANDTLSRTSSSAYQVIKDLTSTKAVVFASAAAFTGNPALATAAVLSQAVLKAPGTPIKIAKGLNKISEYITKNQSGQLTQRIMLAVNNTDNPEELQKSVGGFIAEINLNDNKIDRTVESIKQNQQNIGAVLRNTQGADFANQFHKAVESGDNEQISAFIDAAVKGGALKGLVKEGVGIDGKVYSEEDKAQFDSSIRNSEISAAQRMNMLENLHQNGVIPDLNSVQPREPKKYKSKGKNKY